MTPRGHGLEPLAHKLAALRAEGSRLGRLRWQILRWLGVADALRQIDAGLTEVGANLDAHNASVQATLSALVQRLDIVHARGETVAGRLEAFVTDYHSELVRLARRVPGDEPLIPAAGLVEFDPGFGGRVVGFQHGDGDVGDGVYRSFEAAFRGSEDVIRERQRAYLPLLTGHGPVLDLGCGRGEMLELLGEAGIPATGVDLDAAMVQRCQDKGLEVIQADAIDHLRNQPDGSLGAVFAAQVVEHLPYDALLDLLRTSHAKLSAGGRLVLETVNPHAPQALKNFWIDPTHQHPLFPEVLVLMCALTGYSSGYFWHPGGTGDPATDRLAAPDYAVVAEVATG